MKKQALAIAIASALAAPSAFAAQDTAGMHFTSASEGFYASLRAVLDFSNSGNDANIDEGSSRIGLRGTNDLGGGLEGFYQWEGGVRINSGGYGLDGDNQVWRVRLGNVGLRGNFGEIVVGSFWTNDYNWTHGSTDIANVYSGYLNYTTERTGRSSKSIQYTTPDLNGFQGAIRGVMGGGTDGNDLDSWNLAAQYGVQGFTVGATYNVEADGLTHEDVFDAVERTTATENMSEDLTSWTVRLGYAQDNWYVNGWYGEDALSDAKGLMDMASGGNVANNGVSPKDSEFFSLAGGIAVDKVNLYALYEQRTRGSNRSADQEDTYGTVGVQYNLGAQSRVWIEYWSRDLDSTPTAEDVVSVGLRHDF